MASRLMDRMRYDHWVAKGHQDLAVRANERARKILNEHQVPHLPEAAEKVIAEVLAERAAGQKKS